MNHSISQINFLMNNLLSFSNEYSWYILYSICVLIIICQMHKYFQLVLFYNCCIALMSYFYAKTFNSFIRNDILIEFKGGIILMGILTAFAIKIQSIINKINKNITKKKKKNIEKVRIYVTPSGKKFHKNMLCKILSLNESDNTKELYVTHNFLDNINKKYVCKICKDIKNYKFYVAKAGNKFHISNKCPNIVDKGKTQPILIKDHEMYLLFHLDALCKNCN